MPLSLSPADPAARISLSRSIWLTLAGACVVAMTCLIAITIWLTNAIDQRAEADSTTFVRSALETELGRVEVITVDYAVWEAAYRWVIDRDEDALYDNLGSGATDSDAFDMLVILTPEGAPLFAYQTDGVGSDLTIVDENLVALIHGRMAEPGLAAEDTLTGFTQINGQVMATTVARILPDEFEELEPRRYPLLIGARWLTDAQISDIGDRMLIDGLQVSRTEPFIPEDRLSHPLPSLLDPLEMELVWDAPSPGDALRQQALPYIAFSGLVFLVLSLLVGKVSSRQAETILQERTNARTDQLTGLTNRVGLMDIISHPRFKASWQEGRVAAIFLDLNRFKLLNDTFGHKTGDMALRATADRLCASIRRGDVVARLGGDEFLCLVLADQVHENAKEIVARITARLNEPVHIDDREFLLECAIGVAAADPDMTWDDLVSRADAAMYSSKGRTPSEPVFDWEVRPDTQAWQFAT